MGRGTLLVSVDPRGGDEADAADISVDGGNGRGGERGGEKTFSG